MYSTSALAISETWWTGCGKINLVSGETVLFLGSKDGVNRPGNGLMLATNASNAFKVYPFFVAPLQIYHYLNLPLLNVCVIKNNYFHPKFLDLKVSS